MSGATHKSWYPALLNALQKTEHEGRMAGGQSVFQLATIDTASKGPRVGSHILRSFVTASSLPSLPVLLGTTDIRTSKVSRILSASRVEAVFWTEATQEQFCITGRACVVPAPSYAAPYPALPPPGGSPVFDALREEGVDWEQRRRAVFDQMSPHMKATWCKPVPGTPLVRYDDALEWPEELPRLGKAQNEKEEVDLELALENFALLLIEPFEVDYLELGTKPVQRTTYRRMPGQVAFLETIVVP